jgi:hypothetical protein
MNSPGSTVGACTREESYASIAKAINMSHKHVPEVICVIENMVRQSFATRHVDRDRHDILTYRQMRAAISLAPLSMTSRALLTWSKTRAGCEYA